MINLGFTDFASTTLASAATSSATTLTLASTAHLPASIPGGQPIAMILNDAATGSVFEIVYATAIAGGNLTVERAQEGTTAVAWNAGDLIYADLTAAWLNNFQSEFDTLLSASGQTPSGSSTSQILAAVQGWSGKNIAVFTTSVATVNGVNISWSNGGNWIVPAGVSRVQVFCTGAGGGGAGANPNYGGSGNYISGACGGAGGTAIGFYSVTAGSTLAITVGTAGTGGAGTSPPTSGGAGGTSSVGSLCSATGGLGAAWGGVQTAAGGGGGVGAGGQINLYGGYGGDGQGGAYAVASLAGASYWGGGARSANGTGIAGQAPGAGGGGVYGQNTSGGAGASGVVVIMW